MGGIFNAKLKICIAPACVAHYHYISTSSVIMVWIKLWYTVSYISLGVCNGYTGIWNGIVVVHSIHLQLTHVSGTASIWVELPTISLVLLCHPIGLVSKFSIDNMLSCLSLVTCFFVQCHDVLIKWCPLNCDPPDSILP